MVPATRLKLLYIIVSFVLLISLVIDFFDNEPLKTINTGLLFIGFVLLSIFYPNIKSWRAGLVLSFFVASIALLVYRIYYSQI
jgi:hypothetical protein